MSLPRLTVIPAGAGSGKTFTIQQRLGEWVRDGLVAPERIVAVTFTEAAAAELRERISAGLLAMGRAADALRVDQAYISTIHGFGLRVLTEFAFEAGLSPRPRLLDQDEENRLIRLALTHTRQADELISDLSKYGYSYDHASDKGPEDLFRDDLLRVVAMLRSLARTGLQDDCDDRASSWIAGQYGATDDADSLNAALRKSVEALLAAHPESLEKDYGNSPTAADAFRADFRSLHRASSGDALGDDWLLWKRLRGLRQSKRGCKLPADYDALAAAVIEAAARLHRHPGPLRQAQAQIRALLAAGREVLDHYTRAKREAGLVDYSDMIAQAGQLLRARPAVLQRLVARVDCLVVDEFQDTNPLQFALLWQLYSAGVPTLVVGDLKQAIMGFQGADPRLFAALTRQHGGACRPLTRNWRAQPRLMDLINPIGRGLFGEDYVALEAQRPDIRLDPLDLLVYRKKAKKDWHALRAATLGDRLKVLFENPSCRILDPRSHALRRLRAGDVAVLCPTHSMLTAYAGALRAQGLRVRLQADGWFMSRPVQLVWHALAYLANPEDRHAALYLAVTELGSLGLQQALTQLMDQHRIVDPLLERLDLLAEGLSGRKVDALVMDTIRALDLFDVVALWPDGEQARANLLRLVAEAAAFCDANREALVSGGYHGSGVETFRAWLAARVKERDGDKQPEPRVLDEQAVTLTTWHSAKGLEWPLVAVCGLEHEVKGRLPGIDLAYDRFDDLNSLLDHAWIRYIPKFAADESNERFRAGPQQDAETEACRLLYVALTRARDKLILEWPQHLADKKGVTYWSILTGACALTLTDKGIRLAGEDFACARIEGGLACADEPQDGEAGMAALPVTGRRAIRSGPAPGGLVPDSVSPSTLKHAKAPANVAAWQCHRYGAGLEPDIGLDAAELGTFVHRCFEVLGPRPDLQGHLARITGVAVGVDLAGRIASVVADFERFLDARLGAVTVLREWPVLALDDSGSVISGTIDLLLETPDGFWVIDHKSDRVQDSAVAAEAYRGQLEAYAEALNRQGRRVAGIGIHWTRRGELTLCPWAPPGVPAGADGNGARFSEACCAIR